MNFFSLITPAYAQDAGGFFNVQGLTQLAPLFMIGLVFWFLVLRPQQQKQKELRAMISAVKRGDKVVTAGGIIGVVQKVPTVPDKDGKPVPSSEIEVEIAPSVKVTLLRETITTIIKPVAANDSKPAKAS